MKSWSGTMFTLLLLAMIPGGCGGSDSQEAPRGGDGREGSEDDSGEKIFPIAQRVLEIVSVTREKGPVILTANHWKITARVRSVAKTPVELYIGQWNGKKYALHELRDLHRSDPEFHPPYGLGIESGPPGEGHWSKPMTDFTWQAPGEEAEVKESGQVRVAPGQIREFSVLIHEMNEQAGNTAYRVFLLDPNLQRYDESVLTVKP